MKMQTKNFLLVFLLVFLFYSCATSNNNINKNTGVIVRAFDVVVVDNKTHKVENLSLYTKIDIQKQEAFFKIFTPTNEHLYSLLVKNNNYILTNVKTKKIVKGNLREFKLFPLTKKFIFQELPSTEDTLTVYDTVNALTIKFFALY